MSAFTTTSDARRSRHARPRVPVPLRRIAPWMTSRIPASTGANVQGGWSSRASCLPTAIGGARSWSPIPRPGVPRLDPRRRHPRTGPAPCSGPRATWCSAARCRTPRLGRPWSSGASSVTSSRRTPWPVGRAPTRTRARRGPTGDEEPLAARSCARNAYLCGGAL